MIILSNMNDEEKRQIKIMELYNEGHTYKEISEITNLSESLVKKKVNNWINKMPLNSQELVRKNHKLNSIDKKRIEKTMKYESKRTMSDKEFIIKNRSIYNTSITGNILLKSDLEFGITWDTPKKLKNKRK